MSDNPRIDPCEDLIEKARKQREHDEKLRELESLDITFMSMRPEVEANPHWPGAENQWTESNRICPECGNAAWQAPWYDDPPDAGGSCIGTKYACGDCGWTD